MSFADKIKPYQIPLWTGPIASDEKCYVCLREFGVSDEDDEPACHALRPRCGHFIGSECFLQLLQSDRYMICSMCRTPYPTAGPALIRRIAYVVQWALFFVEGKIFGGMEWIIYGRYSDRFNNLNNLLARGEVIVDMDMANELFAIDGIPLAAFLCWLGIFSLCMTVLSGLPVFPMDTYAEMWLLHRLFGIEMTAHCWLWALVASCIIALIICFLVPPNWEGALDAVEDPEFADRHPVWAQIATFLMFIMIMLPISCLSRVIYLGVFLPAQGKIALLILNWTFGFHAVVYRILVSRNFYV
jgi:hypothetical protein